MESNKIALGSKVKDCINGFEGTATGRAEYLHGSTTVLVEAPAKDGKLCTAWTEESRLAPVEA